MKYIFWGVLFLFFWNACSDGQLARKRSAEFYVRYLAPEQQWLAEVNLRESIEGKNSRQDVESPAGVRYQGVLMRTIPANGITYQLLQGGGYTPKHTFEWQDSQKQPHVFEMEMPAIRNFSFGSDSLSNKKPASLRWEGAPLEAQESVVMMWETTNGEMTVPMEIISSPGQKSIEFPAAQMGKLPAGTWSLYLVRKKRTKQQIDGTKAMGLVEYYTHSDTLVVHD